MVKNILFLPRNKREQLLWFLFGKYFHSCISRVLNRMYEESIINSEILHIWSNYSGNSFHRPGYKKE